MPPAEPSMPVYKPLDQEDTISRRAPPDENAKVSVGAGARIKQDVKEDPMSVEDWKSEPTSIIRLYFVFESKFEKILNDGGIKDLDGDKEGYLKGVKVG